MSLRERDEDNEEEDWQDTAWRRLKHTTCNDTETWFILLHGW